MLCWFFVQYLGCWHDISWCRKVAKRQWKCNSFCLKVLHPDVAGKSTEVVQLLLLFPKKCAGICIPAMPFLVDKQKINEGTQEVKRKSPLKYCAVEMFIPQERFRQLKEVGIFQFDCLKRILALLHTEGLWAWHGSAEEGLAKLKVQEEWHTSGQHCAKNQFQNEVKPQFGTQQGAQAHHSHRTTLRLPGVRCRCRFRGFLDRWLDCLCHDEYTEYMPLEIS